MLCQGIAIADKLCRTCIASHEVPEKITRFQDVETEVETESKEITVATWIRLVVIDLCTETKSERDD